MDLGLKGKLAVVTGSTAGIGFAIASRLASEGAEVIINGRSAQRVDRALELIHQASGNRSTRGIVGDLGTAAGAAEFVQQIPAADILVNNVGIFEPKPFLEIPDQDWLRLFEVNVLSGVRLTRHFLPAMVAKKWGRVVFISSESAQQSPPEMIHYGMTKTAQVAIARGIAESVAATGVTVNSILVGPTASEGVSEFVAAVASQKQISKEEFEREFFVTARPSSLLKRFQTPAEIASVVAFVVSTQAEAINGAAVRAEGGVLRSLF